MSHLRREFIKLLYQKRTYFGWAGLFIVPFLVTIPAYFQSGTAEIQEGQQAVVDFAFGFVTTNGLFVALGTLFALAVSVLPLLGAVSGSQTFAGEAEKGTLRTTLMQPARRGALLAAKWSVANLYMAIGLALLLAGSLIAGGAFFGLRPLLLLGTETVHGAGLLHSLILVFSAYLFVLIAMATAVSLALLFSTLTDSALTALAGSLTLVFVMIILGNLPSLEFLHPYLFTSHFSACFNFLRDPLPWTPIRDALLNFAAWIAATTGFAWIIFRRKDIHS
jgi:ABC-2 type transport system permease protein